ncbi:OmpA family protein [Polaribacter sp. Z022]|uniref:OmpA family protein n=1 Tax=Polaribacter sp. Z022 TaxID=2927125 RepID=UPI0020209805|nr:OmpA family protein [Polaribacter sp. Z022]MCL7753298.1 OmpA family protein [Polaribacter sp. Z022]
MKKITILVFCFFSIISMAQNKETTYSKWLFKVGANIVDNSGDTNPFNGFELKKMGFSNNIAGGLEYRFHKHWSAGLFLSINKFKAPDAELDGEFITMDLDYFATDLSMKYYLRSATNELNRFNMYLSGGVGMFKIVDNTLSLNFGGGLVYWLNDSFGVTLESVAKFTTENDVQYDSNHFQHFAGITFRLGKKDSDKDGVVDKEDACPNTFGLVAFKGCPDADNDGIKDSEDACPNVAGLKAFNGCPDTDKDGVIDSLDNCKNTFGPKENNGCPYKDTDKDGVLDKDDACPEVIGDLSYKGCPKPKEIVVEKEENLNAINTLLEDYAQVVLFETGKFEFTKETLLILEEVITVLKPYPNAIIIVEGHTDNVGAAHVNKVLSQKRADAIKAYLVKNSSIESNKIQAIGYGETQPINANVTRAQRKLNRRVVLKVQ